MREIVTRALVLSAEPRGEADLRLILYSRTEGRMMARASGARKILSKLAAHIVPGSISDVRLIGDESFQLADALLIERLPFTRDREAAYSFVGDFLFPNDPDHALWELLCAREGIDSAELLRVLGFDPREARCSVCRKAHPSFFHSTRATYVCEACAPPRVAPSLYRWYSSL